MSNYISRPALTSATAWLKQHPAIADTARQRANTTSRDFPDAVLDDPGQLVNLFK
jgi:hypothetical protein